MKKEIKIKLASLDPKAQVSEKGTAFVVPKKNVKRGTELRTKLNSVGASVKYLGGPLAGKAKVEIFD